MFFPEKYDIYLKPGVTDMRKSINTLSAVVRKHMQSKAANGDLYVFCNRRRDIIKILYWHRTGFCLWQKRLEKDKFPWPDTEDISFKLSHHQLRMLLDGIDFFAAHEELVYAF